jgi:RTX calcium-binding nonapeptide repeat (4 copies)
LAILTVTNTNDSGVGSLRAAVEAANLNANLDTIVFAQNLAGQTVVLTSGEVQLSNDLFINGDVNNDGKADITISGGGAQRVFNQSGVGTDVHLLSLTLTDGHVGNDLGGAIKTQDGTLEIKNTTIQNSSAHLSIFDGFGNASETGIGGGLAANNTVVLVDHSLIVGNYAATGGGIDVVGGSLTLLNSTVFGNSSAYSGGGFHVSSGTLALLNSTVTHNRANSDGTNGGSGGAFALDGTSQSYITNSVVAENNSSMGGILYNYVDNVSGTVTTATNSVFGSFSGSITNNIHSFVGVDTPGLLALADNGGSVRTQNISADSLLLINGGNDAAASGIVRDGNGQYRVQGQHVDIGATEFQSIEVTMAGDVVNAFDRQTSLREAILFSNANGNLDRITFAASLAGQTIILNSELTVTEDLIIDGDSNGDHKADITISGNNGSRIFVETGATTDLRLSSLTLTNGQSGAADGGAIFSTGGSLSILDTTLQNNHGFSGGALRVGAGCITTVTNSLFVGNSSTWDGGAVSAGSGTTTIVNSTFYGNSSSSGSAISNVAGTTELLNNTITGNTAQGTGGAIYVVSGTVNTTNTVVAANLNQFGGIGNDVRGTISSATNTVFGTAPTVANGNAVSFEVTDVGLGELLNNGGTVLTRAPLDASFLISSGSLGALPLDVHDIDHDGNVSEALPLDGRGGARSVDINVEVGAVEYYQDEIIIGTNGVNHIFGGLGTDVLSGLAGGDTLDGGDGNDTADYRASTGTNVNVDLLQHTASGGHATGDTLDRIENLYGSLTQRDILIGDIGNNILKGFGGIDSLIGNGGDDFIEGGAAGDTINGGAGSGDTASYRDSTGSNVSINLLTSVHSGGDAQGDLLFFIENLEGSLTRRDILVGNNVANRIFGNGGADIIQGQGGNDFIDGGVGADSLNAGAGIDTVSYEKSSAGVTVDLNVALQVSVGDANGDSLFFFENVDGSDFGDNLKGSLVSNRLVGGLGMDTLNGGTGSDYLTGGADADTFRFTDLSFGSDTITDWNDGVDHISIALPLETSFAGLTFTGNGSNNVIVRGFNGTGSAIIVKADAAFTLDVGDFVFV